MTYVSNKGDIFTTNEIERKRKLTEKENAK